MVLFVFVMSNLLNWLNFCGVFCQIQDIELVVRTTLVGWLASGPVFGDEEVFYSSYDRVMEAYFPPSSFLCLLEAYLMDSAEHISSIRRFGIFSIPDKL